MSDKDHMMWVSPEVQGRVVKMELEAVSVLPYKQSKKHFGHVKLAEPCHT